MQVVKAVKTGKIAIFRVNHILLVKLVINFPVVVQQHYVCEVGN